MSSRKLHSSKETEISRFIRELRQLTDSTQEEFGKKIGVSYETVSRWENGRMQPSPLAMRQLEQVIQGLSASPDPVIRSQLESLLNRSTEILKPGN